MAKTAWRCSQCGTVNEPDARACRSCGKWPSLFDLQDNAVPDEELEPAPFEADEFQPDTFEPEPFEPEVFGEEPSDVEVGDVEAEGEERRGRVPRWLVTAIWVVGLLVWILVNALADR
jgi:hypothetical protein